MSRQKSSTSRKGINATRLEGYLDTPFAPVFSLSECEHAAGLSLPLVGRVESLSAAGTPAHVTFLSTTPVPQAALGNFWG